MACEDPSHLIRDLREQLGSVLDTLVRLRDRVINLKAKLVHHVDQGEGLTHEQLVEVYEELVRLFPSRARKASDDVDDRSRST